MSTVHVCGELDDVWEMPERPDTIEGLRDKLRLLRNRRRQCMRWAKRRRGTQMNMRWLHWFGEWSEAFNKADEVRARLRGLLKAARRRS